jgi:hypothetical protein
MLSVLTSSVNAIADSINKQPYNTHTHTLRVAAQSNLPHEVRAPSTPRFAGLLDTADDSPHSPTFVAHQTELQLLGTPHECYTPILFDPIAQPIGIVVVFVGVFQRQKTYRKSRERERERENYQTAEHWRLKVVVARISMRPSVVLFVKLVDIVVVVVVNVVARRLAFVVALAAATASIVVAIVVLLATPTSLLLLLLRLLLLLLLLRTAAGLRLATLLARMTLFGRVRFVVARQRAVLHVAAVGAVGELAERRPHEEERRQMVAYHQRRQHVQCLVHVAVREQQLRDVAHDRLEHRPHEPRHCNVVLVVRIPSACVAVTHE